MKQIEELLKLQKVNLATIKNLELQLNFLPTLVPRYDKEENIDYIANDTAEVACNRICSKEAKKIKQQIEELKLLTNMIQNVIDTLTPIERRIVELRWFKEYSFAETADLMFLSEKTIYRKRKEILSKFEKSLINYL